MTILHKSTYLAMSNSHRAETGHAKFSLRLPGDRKPRLSQGTTSNSLAGRPAQDEEALIKQSTSVEVSYAVTQLSFLLQRSCSAY